MTSKNEHDFSLVLTGVAELTSEIEDALFESGCDDSTIGFRQGRLILTFSRNAVSLKEAVFSAIHDIKKAKIQANTLRIDFHGLVTRNEIALKIDRPLHLLDQYILGIRGPGDFPAPIHGATDENPLWDWLEVAHWLWDNGMIKEHVLRETQETYVINSVLDLQHQRRLDPALTDEVLRVIDSAIPGGL